MVLIGVVVVLFLISFLVVAMLSQSASTAFPLSYENRAKRIYYLAESGFRYALARIRHGADMKTDLHLHDGPFSLANGAGSFDLSFFPHYLVIPTAIAAESTTLTAQTPGGYDNGSADALVFPGGSIKKVRIIASDGTWDEIHSYTSVSVSPIQDETTGKYTAAVMVTLEEELAQSLPAGSTILPVAQVSDMDDNGGIEVVGGSAAAFPHYNGTFRVYGKETVYAYAEKDGDTLSGITAPLDPDKEVPFEFEEEDEIVLEPFVRITSTGTFNDTSRAITYHVPMASPEITVTLADDFKNLHAWDQTTSLGSFDIDKKQNKAAETTAALAGDAVAEIRLDKDSDIVETIEKSWQYGNEGYLSYDAQVKVGFDVEAGEPEDGTVAFGNPDDVIPNYYMAGLKVRVGDIRGSTETTGYGLSVMRGPGASHPVSSRLVPAADRHLLVLWQQSGPEAHDLNWLAYMDMNPVFFSDDFEDAFSAKSLYKQETELFWTGMGDVYSSWTADSENPYQGLKSMHARLLGYPWYWYFHGEVKTVAMDLEGLKQAQLSFFHKYKLSGTDFREVEATVFKNGTVCSSTNFPVEEILEEWTKVKIDISDCLPCSDVQIRFYIANLDAAADDYWYIDDVAISKQIPVQETTLAIRIQETAIVAFENGIDTESGTGFEDGDTVYEAGGRVYGIVDGPPVITGGQWTAGDPAKGVLALSYFNDDENKTGDSLKAVGNPTTATLIDYSKKENLIRCFIADPQGEGDSSDFGSATDFIKDGYPINDDIRWPPDPVSAWSQDHDDFMLVRWDGGNTDIESYWQDWGEVENGADIESEKSSLISPVDAPRSIVRSGTLETPASGSLFGRSELGLYTFGDGALSTYFDDFAVKLSVGTQYQYAPVVQE